MNEVEKLILMSKKTAKELAVILNTSENNISRYKTGKVKIPVDTLKEWSRKLNIDIRELF